MFLILSLLCSSPSFVTCCLEDKIQTPERAPSLLSATVSGGRGLAPPTLCVEVHVLRGAASTLLSAGFVPPAKLPLRLAWQIKGLRVRS